MTATKPAQPAADAIDLLMPPPMRGWLRLCIGFLIVGAVGLAGFLWQFGHLRPVPDCCGGGELGGAMALTSDGRAVTMTAGLFNSSRVDIVVTGAHAELEGAEVLSIGTVDPDRAIQYPIPDIAAFPATAPAHEFAEVVITFVPQRCSVADANTTPDAQSGWGWVTLALETPDSWYPTFGRSFRLPEPLAGPGSDDLSVWAPEGRDDAMSTDDPLLAACRLLGR